MRFARFAGTVAKMRRLGLEPGSFLPWTEAACTHVFIGVVEVVQELGSNHLQKVFFFLSNLQYKTCNLGDAPGV